jgi:hypothetical protein
MMCVVTFFALRFANPWGALIGACVLRVSTFWRHRHVLPGLKYIDMAFAACRSAQLDGAALF